MKNNLKYHIMLLALTASLINWCSICSAGEDYHNNSPKEDYTQEKVDKDSHKRMTFQDYVVVTAAICTILATVCGGGTFAWKVSKREWRRHKLNKILSLCSELSTKIREELKNNDEDKEKDEGKKYEYLDSVVDDICRDKDGLVDQMYEAYRNNESIKQIIIGKALRELRESKDRFKRKFQEQKKKLNINDYRNEMKKYTTDEKEKQNLEKKLNHAYGEYKKLVEGKLEEVEDKVAEIDGQIRSTITL